MAVGKTSNKKLVIITVILAVIVVVTAGVFTVIYFNNMAKQKALAETESQVKPDTSFLNVYGEKPKTPDGTLEYNNTIMCGNGKLFRTSDVDYKFNKKKEKQNFQDILYVLKKSSKISNVLYVQRPSKYNPDT
ncbi:MAG: hypothetical protein HUJ78_03845, partial [Mogibacterium sp.]|nr:hypothetical protein [Mogibacterium sp.]